MNLRKERQGPKPVVKQVITLMVEDQPNVMARVTSLFGRRNFNINTLSASETGIPIIINSIGTIKVIKNINNKNPIQYLIPVFIIF